MRGPRGLGLPLDITSCKPGLVQIRGANWLVLEVAPRICFAFLHGVSWKTWCRISIVSSLRGWKLQCFNFTRKSRFPAPLEAQDIWCHWAVCPWGAIEGVVGAEQLYALCTVFHLYLCVVFYISLILMYNQHKAGL